MRASGAGYSAFDTAVYYITYKDRTERELRDKLAVRGYRNDEIDACIIKLSEYGYLNDAGYALSYIKSNLGRKGVGRIRLELIKKGVDREIISEVSENITIDETGVIVDMLNRRYKTTDLGDERAVKRMYGFFLRRGFRHESIRKALGIFGNNYQ